MNVARTSAGAAGTAANRSRSESLGILAVLAVFGVFAAMWALFIPIPAASPDATTFDGFNPDEQIHLRLIAYLATHHALPLFDPHVSAPIYTVVHPPLYHLLGALVYGIAVPAIGYPNTVLLLRLLTVLFGIGAVALTYRTARRLFSPWIALLAAGCAAGVPMFVSLSGAVSNEVPAACMASGALAAIADGLRHGFDRRRTLQLALWVAAGSAIKVTDFLLVPVALAAVWLGPRRSGAPRAGRPVSLAIVGGVWAVAVGWWLVRNQALYGDPLLAGVHHAYWSAHQQRPWQAYMNVPWFLWDTLIFGWLSFWGTFDAFSRLLPNGALILVGLIQLPAVIGFVLWGARGGLRGYPARRHAVWMGALFAALMIALFYAINWRIYSPQGRYLFPLLTPFGIATALGWLGSLRPRWRPGVTALLLAALVGLNAYTLATMSVRPEKKAASAAPSR